MRSAFKSVSARALKLVRAATCLAVLFALAGFLSLRVARAEASEHLRGFGAELLSLPSAHAHSAPRRLSVNGLELKLLTLSTEESVRQALDRFQARCGDQGAFAPKALKALLVSPLDGTLRDESDDEGFVACIAPEASLSFEDWVDRLRVFAENGDLAVLGELRYAFVRRSGSQTTIVALWTEGSAKLLELFPPSGDAPGHDPPDVPRPAHARRLLSGTEHGAPYSLTLYEVEGRSVEALRNWYAQALEAAGWKLVTRSTEQALVLTKGARTLSVHVTLTQTGRIVASVAELS